jgi:hypothetical protein
VAGAEVEDHEPSVAALDARVPARDALAVKREVVVLGATERQPVRPDGHARPAGDEDRRRLDYP